MNFVVYLIGYLLVVAGVSYAMHMAGIGGPWILAIALVMGGLGLVYALSRSQRDKAKSTAAGPTAAQSGPAAVR